MRQSFVKADFDALARFWNGFYPERYRIDSDLLRQNSVGSPTFDWGASFVETEGEEIQGFVLVKRSPASLYKGPDKDQAHLCAIAYREPMIGLDLLADVKRTLRNRGITRIDFGQDSRHFFPGCPTDFRALADFLMVEGFAPGGESHDLERDLSDYQNPAPRTVGDEYRILTKSDVPSLDDFISREFPGRWTYDVIHKVGVEGHPHCIFGFLRDGKVEGFALLQDDGCKVPIGGAVWRNDLGEKWGSLGPIGVSKKVRGQGCGNALLGAALEELRDRGVKRCIIDWTGLVDFYGKHGFQVTRSYQSLSLPLEMPG
jgi:predicted N-acetyltransferase YhbS